MKADRLRGSLLLVLVLTLGVGPVRGQRGEFAKPEYKAIERAVADNTSGFYYPKLMARFLSGDSTLTLEERRHVYYGYQFQPTYSPYGFSPHEKELGQLMNKEGHLSQDELRRVVVLSDSVLSKNPFDLTAISFRMFGYEMLGDHQEVQRTKARGNIMLDAIYSSGDGRSKKTALYVLYTRNEYSIINILGYKFEGQSLVDLCDVMKVSDNPDGIKELYFDVSALFASLSREHGKK